MEGINEEDLNKALEEQAVWEVINFLEDKLEELEEVMDTRNLTEEEQDEYFEKSKQINELLDIIDNGDEE
jgi:hypothetical protein